MPRQIIDTGTLELNGQDGDTNRDAADKCNANFQELYAQNESFVRGAGVVPGGAMVVFAGTTGNQVAAAAGGAPGTAAFRNATEFATAAQGAKADNAQAKLSPGANITIDNTDPLNPIISASGGGGAVATVAGVEPFGGDIPAAELVIALGVDQKLGLTATAAAATKLATPRNINGVAFDGTANITVTDNTKEPAITAGTASQYWSGLKAWVDFATSVRASVLTGLSLATSTAVAAADSVLVAIGKLQAQVSLKLNADANAVSASKLNTARTINGVAFDGTANITLPASGAAWGGITGTLSAQTDLQAALDAKGSIITKETLTAGQAWTSGGQVNFTHSAGQPKVVVMELVFKQAVNGLAVGEVVQIGPSAFAANSTYYGCEVRKLTATSVQVQIAASGVFCYNASGTPVVPTTAQADLRLRILG